MFRAALWLWLVASCSSDRDSATAAVGSSGSARAPIAYDEFHAALGESEALTETCIAAVRAGFDRPKLAGASNDKPPPDRAPSDRRVLRDAIVFEVPISILGDVANFAPESMLPIHELQDQDLYAHVDHDAICGIHDRIDALGMWPEHAAQGLALLRSKKQVPPLALFYWRWCDQQLGFNGPFTCSVGLVWMRFPSKEIVAMASGVGTAKASKHPDDSAQAPYVVAMHRAEERVIAAVRGW